jgi:DNA-binding transcriptional regulator YiaG
MSSYREAVTEKAAKTMAHMLDFAVHDLRQDASAFFELFTASGIADMFGNGDIRLTAGTSGVELAYRVLGSSGITAERVSYRYTSGRSREYWTGYALGRYQAERSIPFSDIIGAVSLQVMITMCDGYREAEIRSIMDSLNWMDTLTIPDHMNEDHYREFSSHIDDKVASVRATSDTRLKRLRIRSGYSQSGLAAASGVPVRTIQQYEQRQKDINKAAFESIIKLAAAIGCEPSALME